MEVLVVLAVQLLFALLTCAAAVGRNRSGIIWFFLGIVFGVLAFIVVLVAGERRDSDPPARL